MKKRLSPIAPPGYRFIGAGLAVFILGFWLGILLLTIFGLVLTGFFIYFFRDPERSVPVEEGLIICPADGRIIVRELVREERFLHQTVQKISIFMNVFDVHVNRAPMAGVIKGMEYQAGKYVAADRPEAPQVNEQLALLLENDSGIQVVMVQIAGLLARRIISFVKEGSLVDRGERVGLICFGSRVDLYLPEECTLLVDIGDRVKAGSSIVGRFP